jgi:hypothetical protein
LCATRVHAAVTALVFVVSSWLGMVHEATTRHVRCAEHDEQVDVAARPGEPARRTAPVERDADRSAMVRDASSPIALHGHEHCSLVSTLRVSRIATHPPALHAASIAIADVATAPPGVAIARTAALYRTAPKTSPPA